MSIILRIRCWPFERFEEDFNGFQLCKGCAQLRTTNTRQPANNFGQVACSLVPPPSLNDGLVDPAARKAQNFLPCGPPATEKVLVTHGNPKPALSNDLWSIWIILIYNWAPDSTSFDENVSQPATKSFLPCKRGRQSTPVDFVEKWRSTLSWVPKPIRFGGESQKVILAKKVDFRIGPFGQGREHRHKLCTWLHSTYGLLASGSVHAVRCWGSLLACTEMRNWSRKLWDKEKPQRSSIVWLWYAPMPPQQALLLWMCHHRVAHVESFRCFMQWPRGLVERIVNENRVVGNFG